MKKPKIRVVEGNGTDYDCLECYFDGKKECEDIKCFAMERNDKRDVYFIEVKDE